ncbi:MAG: HEAT repeat domain-containing protein [Chloroflexi bacterium]|nr:HEAT repeat domain-containing protein [Chloroflexota bacterium]
MTDSEFQQQLQSIVADGPPELHENYQQTIDQITSYGIGSFEELLAVVRDEAAAPEIRSAGCWLLGQFRQKRAVYAVLRAFDSQHDDLRRQAAHTLGVLGSKVAVKPLLKALEYASTVERRADAAYALGHIGDERAAQPLLNRLNDAAEDDRVRSQAAESLAYLAVETADVRAALIAALADASAEVRFWSAFTLGELGDPSDHATIRALEHLAASDTTVVTGWWSVGQEAQAALAKLTGDDEG